MSPLSLSHFDPRLRLALVEGTAGAERNSDGQRRACAEARGPLMDKYIVLHVLRARCFLTDALGT